MRLLYLGSDDAYAVRRLREESRKRRIRFEVLRPEDIKLTTNQPTRFADMLIIRTQHPRWIPHTLTLARVYRTAGKIVVDATLGRDVTIYSKLNDVIVLATHGIPVPHSILAPSSAVTFSPARHYLHYPIVAKAIHGAGGNEVFLIPSVKKLAALLRQYSHGSLMLQEYLDAPYDFRVLVLGYKALPLLLRRYPKRGDFRTNAKFAARVEALPISQLPDVARIAERAARLLKREFTGVDLRFRYLPSNVIPSQAEGSRSNTPLVLEVNRQPEFETFEKYTGLNVAGAFLEYVTRKKA